MTASALVQARDLAKHYPIRAGLFHRPTGEVVRAVDGVSFDVHRGETLALVGESGCGKSTTGRLLLRLVDSSAGSVHFDGADMLAMNAQQFRSLRRRLQMVFQDPSSAFNPHMTVSEVIAEPMRLAGASAPDGRSRVAELLPLVGLPASFANRYPHEFSGGQRQRIGIARALALQPDFIVCDEPVSALDVSIQAQVVNLLTDLQQRFGLTYLFVSHDLRVVRHIASRVAVMYLGRIVEIADKRTLYRTPLHPYTQALIAAVPVPKLGTPRRHARLSGEVGSASRVPTGCRFHTRCPKTMPICREQDPISRKLADGHIVACHLVT
jgi:oligopeptide/dipeptide ABC transporter ATP-binding protein